MSEQQNFPDQDIGKNLHFTRAMEVLTRAHELEGGPLADESEAIAFAAALKKADAAHEETIELRPYLRRDLADIEGEEICIELGFAEIGELDGMGRVADTGRLLSALTQASIAEMPALFAEAESGEFAAMIMGEFVVTYLPSEHDPSTPDRSVVYTLLNCGQGRLAVKKSVEEGDDLEITSVPTKSEMEAVTAYLETLGGSV